MKTCSLVVLLFAAVVAPLPAQKTQLPDGSGRQVQMLDLARLTPDPYPPAVGQQLAAFLRRFVSPPLGPGDDLCVLGGRWLVVLGSPEQGAAVERMFARALARPHDLIEVRLQLLRVPADDFEALVLAHVRKVERDGGVTYEGVLAEEDRESLRRGLAARETVETITAPQVVLRPMQRGTVDVVDQTSYVKDFDLTRHGDSVVADPIVDTVWSGVRTEVIGTVLSDATLGLYCVVEAQELEKPIQVFTSTVADLPTPLQVQLPRVTGVRFEQTCELAAGDGVVLGAQRLDGSYVVAILSAHLVEAK